MKKNAIILAGGRSSRMGGNKALLRVGGVPLIRRQAALLSPMFDDVLISCKRPEEYKFLGLTLAVDEFEEDAAMVGLYSGLRASDAEVNFCIACDMPLVHPGLIEHMLSLAGAPMAPGAPVVPESERGVEPLYAVYRKDCADAMGLLIAERRYSLREMLLHLDARIVSRDEVARICGGAGPFLNVNRPEDLRALE